MERSFRSLTSVLLATAALAASAQTLDIGSPAPALRPSKWLKGERVARFEKGKAYAIEFWATWCGPCKKAMPHLSELARKHRGKVEFIGIDAFEPNDLPKVADFVAKQGSRMDYRVAADGPGDSTWNNWMIAAGETGIPQTFVVGKDGRIAWIGHPDELEGILAKLQAGTLDLSAEKRRRAERRNPESAVTIALGKRDYARVVSLVEAEEARRPPTELFCPHELYEALAHLDVAKLRERVRADLARTQGGFATYNWVTLALLVTGIPVEAARFGSEMAEEAAEKHDAKLMFLARGAEMAMKAGDRNRAIALQTRAIEAAPTTPSCTPERLAELKNELERYRKAD